MLVRNRYLGELLKNSRSFSVLNSSVRSGHNKWSTIKHGKAKNDAERNKINNKFANQIAMSVKLGNGITDPSMNIRLATSIELANKNNVSKKVIENAIRKASGSSASGKDSNASELCVYEGMGPGGVAIVVEALTDNKNRTIGLIRSAFNKANGSMTPTLFFFDKKGYVTMVPPKMLDTEDKVLESVLEIQGIEDIAPLQEDAEDLECDTETETTGQTYEAVMEPADTNKVAALLKERGFHIRDLGIGYNAKPDMDVFVQGDETLEKLQKLTTALEDIDEVTSLYTNASNA
ncbi:BAD_HP_G0018020.mRNA.1.CDS.1 [Saccharomyces cerevisiae]|nr:hypothetical protein H749_YJM195G00278 [Saccharomyces cerevisiae YJM195]AJR96852.1 hypothetical protein H788_YJM1248G00274 [Saccharomyces cerevisiae YJM1248]AJS01323.1 hypothetical protein H820_YJM1439G00264 [Saccharomyces cerevisiae YJM1439]CAH1830163.1 unnamed protein product [Saccharomyces cerevisiae]CAI4492808.1 AKH_1a_G0019890.mRNA.1.CDS.1 [Saccharomyces cerevisiae]